MLFLLINMEIKQYVLDTGEEMNKMEHLMIHTMYTAVTIMVG